MWSQNNFVYSLTPSKHSLLYHICYICYICFIGGQLVNYCKRMMIDPAEILSSGKKFWFRQKIVTLGCARTWFWTKADFPLKDWKVQRREICSVIIEFLPQAIDQESGWKITGVLCLRRSGRKTSIGYSFAVSLSRSAFYLIWLDII